MSEPNVSGNPVPAGVNLSQLVALIDARMAELVNPMELRDQLIASVGRFRAALLWNAALAVVLVRDDWRDDEFGYGEAFCGSFAVLAALVSLFLTRGAWSCGFAGVAVALGVCAVCHLLARLYRAGEL